MEGYILGLGARLGSEHAWKSNIKENATINWQPDGILACIDQMVTLTCSIRFLETEAIVNLFPIISIT